METYKEVNVVTPFKPNLDTINPTKRLLFIDNIRWLMIVFVVLIHLNCTYGNIGLWYYQEPSPGDFFSISFFSIIGSHTQAYFMGFLFLIAGFFVPGSFDKKGGGRFIRDRLFRLGIPTLVYMALLHPITILIMDAFNHRLSPNLVSWYRGYLFSSYFIGGSGPLWFALALLIFSIIYALIRSIFPQKKTGADEVKPAVITHPRILALIALISLFAFGIRLVQPIGTAFYNMQLCNFSQYIILFSLGILTYRCNLLTNLSSEFGGFWFRLALYLGIPFWSLITLLGGALTDGTPFAGGFHWQAAAYAVWESFFCVGICLGLLVLFRDNHNTQGKLSRFLSDNAFGVYVFHTPLLVWATMMVRGIAIYPVLKMILMSIIMLPVCFGFSYLLRKVPLMKRIFS